MDFVQSRKYIFTPFEVFSFIYLYFEMNPQFLLLLLIFCAYLIAVSSSIAEILSVSASHLCLLLLKNTENSGTQRKFLVIFHLSFYVEIYRDFLAILHHSLSGNLRSYLHYDSSPGNSAN